MAEHGVDGKRCGACLWRHENGACYRMPPSVCAWNDSTFGASLDTEFETRRPEVDEHAGACGEWREQHE